MFEFEDSRLGKIKVISVTEARTAMATIMTDKTFNYVITKNNRPIRVIINYDTYRTQFAPLVSGKMSSSKGPKGSIKGLIETREKELKDQVSRFLEAQPQVQEAQKVVGGEDFVPTENSPSPAVEAKPEIPEAILEEIPEETPVVFSREPEPVPEPAPEPEPDYFGARANPEQSDYFARFRKLYESPPRPSHQAVAQPAMQPSNPPSPSERVVERVTSSLPEPPEMATPAPEGGPLGAKSSPVSRDRRPEPPSIQDLLQELENTKLSGEE